LKILENEEDIHLIHNEAKEYSCQKSDKNASLIEHLFGEE
jgi:hypothetical protein